VLLLGTFTLFSGFSHADDGGDDTMSAKDVKTLFLVMTIVRVLPTLLSPHGMLLASWKPPAATYVLPP
jgi:hypothetical protein